MKKSIYIGILWGFLSFMPFFRNSVILGLPFFIGKEIEFFLANLTNTIFSINRAIFFSVPMGLLISVVVFLSYSKLYNIYSKGRPVKKRRYLR